MICTPELRFVERTIKTPYGNDGAEVSKTIRVLQQKWEGGMREETEGFFRREIEWRDVPLVNENSITDPSEIRRVFELDDTEYPPPDSGFMKL